MKKQSVILSATLMALLMGCSSKPTEPTAIHPQAPVEGSVTPPAPPPPHDHHHHDHEHPPAPPEALKACENKKQDEKCMFQTPRKDVIRGTCLPHGPEAKLECHPQPPKKK
ncbi:hypothetical protein AZI86_17770 [Bdellovibrio bacteriovorus]|uniref:Lipoprotein n=1 Tax=Bdellovibrio bacteriovorus TaxID=959 RepID=A0A150WF27_BDEBC|nr:hypothetical protein [Bdellovibrio bacteriovorus]KYG61554.1 hypothetical protein AZI86_17770 [Bdellovibrio bacteriovorus]